MEEKVSRRALKLAKKAILIKRGELSYRYGELYNKMAESHTEEELLAIIAQDPEYVAPVSEEVTPEPVVEEKKPVARKKRTKKKRNAVQ